MKNILKLLKRINEIHKNFIKKFVIFSLIMGILPLFSIIAPKLIIDEIYGQKRLKIIFIIAFLVLIFDLIRGLVNRLNANLITEAFESFIDIYTFKLSEKAIKLPIEKSDSKTVQDEMEKSHFAIFEIYKVVDTFTLSLNLAITGIFSLIILMKLSVLVVLVVLILILLNKKIVKLIKKNELDYQKNDIPKLRAYRFFINFSQDHRYFKDIKIYNGENFILKKSEIFHQKLVKNSSAYYTKNGIYVGLMNVFSNFSILGSLFFLVVKLIEKAISLADFTLYFNSLISLINASKEIQKNYAQVIAFNGQLQSLFDFLNQKEENFDEGKIKKINTENITIKFDNVSFKYPKSKENILENCSFEIKNGETVALVGKNGAGKSTIVKLLCKFYKPTKGNIYLNGININDIDTKTYYKILSPTFQDFRLFPFRISENISANLLGEITNYQREKMEESFYLLNLKSWMDKLVNKEDTFLTFLFSKNSVEPSGGIGQKLALSRSMVHEGKFFIMDEPTSALDPRSEQEIFEKMLDISKGQTSLFISHRLSSTKYADRIIICDNKKITENGNHEELMKEGGLYKKMYLSQAKLYD